MIFKGHCKTVIAKESSLPLETLGLNGRVDYVKITTRTDDISFQKQNEQF